MERLNVFPNLQAAVRRTFPRGEEGSVYGSVACHMILVERQWLEH